jgi:membrane-associated phospholipid phosphatase
MRRSVTVAVLVSSTLLWATHAAADDAPPAPAAAPAPMPYDLRIDLPVTIGAGALVLTLELLHPSIAPKSCRWCDRNADGSDGLNGFDASIRDALRWSDTSTADTLSTVFSFALAPAAGVGIGALIAAHDGRLDEVPADLLVVAESAMIAVAANQIAKLAFGRARPYVHFRPAGDTAAGSGDNLSFFSGHATLAFALATSAGTVASMRGYRLAPLMWASGMALATTSGYLRIAADQHYATDVIAGAVVGAAVGFAVPYFAHHPVAEGARLAAVPVAGGGVISLAGAW